MQMTLRGFVNNFAQVIEQTKVNMAIKLQKGQLASMETYNRDVGRAEGLDNAVALARDMLGQIESAVDEDDLPEIGSGRPTKKRGSKK